MDKEVMDEKYIRIAELTEQIEKLSNLIELHQRTTNNQSMIRQYAVKRDELIEELRVFFQSIQLTVSLANAA
ncbi:MAG: hypothetical protein EOO48_14465 [Flavobacterium sp.]|nr:MAG: hypothetical protein EOO48_14465 [Flavobacterium sp.]